MTRGATSAVTADVMDVALAEKGWVIIDLPNPAPVFEVRDLLLDHLQRSGLAKLSALDEFHQHIEDQEHYITALFELAQRYWTQDWGRKIIAANVDLLKRLVGHDLHVQRYPYLRAVRPGERGDAVPLHRDTYYGASPYEVSLLIPFTEMSAASALRVISGSHLEPDAAYPFVQSQSQEVVIRSPRHQLGFPYAPRLLDPALDERAEPLALGLGQAAVFGLSLVHGGGVNEGPHTRFSTDIRIANSLAPVQWSRGVHADYFVPLCTSAITRTAQVYEREH